VADDAQQPVNSLPCGATGSSLVCELPTFTAFQIGSICALILALVVYAVGEFAYETTEPEAAQFWLAFLITAIYYTICEWRIEEQYFSNLRNLKWRDDSLRGLWIVSFWIAPLRAIPLAFLEFVIRVAVVVLLAAAVTAIPRGSRMGITGVHAGYVVIIGVYLLFLLWDVLLVEGKQEELAHRFLVPDLIGFGLIAASFYFHHKSPQVGTIAMGCWCIFLGFQFCEQKAIFSRLRRARLR
jgi:hypothetical protein